MGYFVHKEAFELGNFGSIAQSIAYTSCETGKIEYQLCDEDNKPTGEVKNVGTSRFDFPGATCIISYAKDMPRGS